jgi:REP-associated tyrosine transposase
MVFDPERHHRRSIRLQGYDYAQAGAYFVTIVTQGREQLFGDVVGGEMQLNASGQIIAEEWRRTADMRPNVEVDVFIVMPNHVHGIIVINDGGRGVLHGRGMVHGRDTLHGRGTLQRAPTTDQHVPTERFGKPTSNSIPTIVRLFKSVTTKRINVERSTPGVAIWQRNYHEHIIRDDDELSCIREYIANNPLQSALDRENPLVGMSRAQSLPKDDSWRV